MKTILCYGDSNTWGADPVNGGRHGIHTRWPRALSDILNEGGSASDPEWWIVEEGLSGRTTTHDDPCEGDKNGLAHLEPLLYSHAAIDLVIIALGTNDLKKRFVPVAHDIARSAQRLLWTVKNSGAGPDWKAPKVMLVCPPPVATLTRFEPMFGGCEQVSREMAHWYEVVANECGVPFIDAGRYIKSSEADGIHWEAGEHAKIARVLAAKVREILS